MEVEPNLPTKDQLAELPHWACVAFIARSVRRVQPLFKETWPDAPEKYCKVIDGAISTAEQAAAYGGADTGGLMGKSAQAKGIAESARRAGLTCAYKVARSAGREVSTAGSAALYSRAELMESYNKEGVAKRLRNTHTNQR